MISHVARFHIGLIAVVALVVSGIVLGFSAFPGKPTEALATPIAGCIGTTRIDLPITAKAAYAEDMTTGRVLYEQNPLAQLPLASITKVMTVLTASRILPKDSVTVITREGLAPEGDAGLYENESWTTEDLADFTLVTSANDGAHALALAASAHNGKSEAWFVDEMNATASAIGLTGTFFVNDTGLDISSTTAGAYGSARDVAKMMAYAATRAEGFFEGSADAERVFISLSDKKHRAENTSSLAASVAGIMASKTGFTDLAGGNLTAVFEPIPGRPIAAAILGGGRETRDTDMRALADAATKELKRFILCEKADGRESNKEN